MFGTASSPRSRRRRSHRVRSGASPAVVANRPGGLRLREPELSLAGHAAATVLRHAGRKGRSWEPGASGTASGSTERWRDPPLAFHRRQAAGRFAAGGAAFRSADRHAPEELTGRALVPSPDDIILEHDPQKMLKRHPRSRSGPARALRVGVSPAARGRCAASPTEAA